MRHETHKLGCATPKMDCDMLSHRVAVTEGVADIQKTYM